MMIWMVFKPGEWMKFWKEKLRKMNRGKKSRQCKTEPREYREEERLRRGK
jgi:hypothetical protein